MKTTIKSNWLIIVLMALVVCFTAVGIATLRFERGTTVDTPVFADAVYDDPTAGGTELTSIKYSSALDGSDGDELNVTSKFWLEKGASVRVNKETSGLRFTVRYGDVLDSALIEDGVNGTQVKDNYPHTYYNYSLYMIFQKAGTKTDGSEYSKVWVPMTLHHKDALPESVDRVQGSADWDMYSVYSAALNFGNLSAEELAIAKTWEIKASAVVVVELKPDLSTEEIASAPEYIDVANNTKAYFYAGENDNTRSMQAVANAAIQAGEDPEFINQLEGKPFVDQTQVVNFEEETLLESTSVDGEGNVSATIEGISDITETSGIYFGAKKLSTASISGNTITVNTSELTSVTKGEKLSFAIFDAEGKTYNAPVKYVDKIIRTADEMHEIFNIDDGDANTSTPRLVEGYYILGNDIVGTQTYSYKHADMLTVWNDTTTGFKGTFDGNGHYVTLDIATNHGDSKSGIFGQLQSGSVIKNVAFVDCTMDRGVFLFSGVKNNGSATIENVYINFKATGSGTYGGSAWYQTTKIVLNGVFIDNDTATSNISNGKTTAQILAGDIPTNTNHGHGSYVSNEWTSTSSNLNGLIIVAEAPLSYNRPSETTHRMVVAGNAYYADGTKVNDGDAITCPCGDATTLVVEVFNNIYQYASLDELTGYVNEEGEEIAGKLSEISGILTNYSSEYWDFSQGYPRFKSVIEKDRVEGVVSDAKFYVSGAESTDTINLENAGENTSVFLYAEYSGMSFYPTLEILSGESVVVDNVAGTISAKTVTGESTVKATYVIAGVEFEKVYTVLVTLPVLDTEFRYSTNDQKLFASNGFDVYSVKTMVDASDNSIVYYSNDTVSNITGNTDSSDLANYTKLVTVTLDDGSVYSANLVSYTQVIDEDDDFTVFNLPSTSGTLYGYYIVNNDIVLDSFTGNVHGNNYGTSGKFYGTLDGDGHVVEIALGRQGIFGNTANPSLVKDIAFIVKQINSTSSMNATMFGYNGNLDVENVYVKYESTVTIDIGYNSWGQSSGLGLFFYSTADKISNVVFDISEANIVCSKENPFRYGSVFSMYNGTANNKDTWNSLISDFVLYSNLPYFAYMAGSATSGGVSASVNNTYPTFVAFAGNQQAEYDAYVLANNAKETEKAEQVRYFANSLMFANEQALALSGTSVSGFDGDVWDISKGYPEFKGLSNVDTRRDILENTEFYLGGTKGATHADLDTKEKNSTSAYATYNGENYAPVHVEVVEGTVITADTAIGGVVTTGEEGEATFNVYYNVEGVTFVQTYTVSVTLPIFDGMIMYSANDDEIILPDNLAIEDIEDLASADGSWLFGGGGELYSDDLLAIIDENTAAAQATPERFTVQCLLYVVDDGAYYINLESYTKVITTEEDLACLTTDTATKDNPVTGYYALGNDIDYVDWEGNVNTSSYFAGTFDGNGHYVELVELNSAGLFGGIKGATIKNVAFIVNEKGTSTLGGAEGRYILAQNVTSTAYYIQDVYFDVNVAYSSTTNFSIIGVNAGAYMRYSNTIVDFAPGTLVYNTSAWRYGGLFEDYTSSSWFSTQDTDYDGDGVNDNRFNYSAFSNTYYINSDFKYAGFYVGGTAGTLNALYFAENDGALYASAKDTITSSKFGFYKGLKRYDDFNAMGMAGNDYSTFNSDVWDTSKGYPAFKSVVAKENLELVQGSVEFFLGGSNTATEAEIYLGAEGSSVQAYATYKGETIAPTLSIVSGKNYVTLAGDTISARSEGTAKVRATYLIVDEELGVSVTMSKDYVITVTTAKLSGDIWFSTLDGKIYLPDGIELEDVSYLYDMNEFSEIVVEGEINDTSLLPQNTEGTDLAEYTVECGIDLVDGRSYLVDLVSYTKVLTTSSDFAVFNSTTGETKAGYYIMANDIMLDGSWTGNASESGGGAKVTFTGVFDGNGHMAEIALNRYGVFGRTSGATIKNTAFIVKQLGTKTFAHASILAYSMASTTVSNCYFEYDLPEGTLIDTSYYGYGQTSGLGLYAMNSHNVKVKNVVFDMTKVETTCVSNAEPYAYGAFLTKATNNNSNGTFETQTTDAYVLSTNKVMGYLAKVTASGNSITEFTGVSAIWYASNDTEAYEADTNTDVKRQLAGTKRYDNVTAFAGAQGNDYTTFDSNIWSTSNGYPEFTSVIEYKRLQNINTNTEFYLGGSTEATEANLELGSENDSIEVYASLDGETYIPEIVVEGEAVTAVNGVVTAVALGSATITATYDVDGVEFVKTYTITVSAPMLKAELRYSTLTNELFVEDNEFELSTVETIVDSTDSTVYYENDAVTSSIVKNYTVEDLATVTKDVYVAIGGVQYSGKLVSYTQVINEDTDFVIFKEANHATQSEEGHAYASAYEIVSSQPILRGYYVVNNDILLSGDWDGNYHEYNDKAASFGGTFDGDGHVVELKLYSGGLFGALYGATIKDVALVAKDLYADTVTTGRYAFLANQTWSAAGDYTIIDNVYAKYDLDVAVRSKYQSWSRYSGISFVSNNGYYIKYTNSILDATSLEITDVDDLGFFGFTSSAFSSTFETNGYRSSTTNNYFITSLPYVAHALGVKSNAYTGDVYKGYGANQTAEYEADTTSAYKYQYAGISLYANYEAMATAGNDYSSYNTEVWTIEEGKAPVFTAYAEYVEANEILASTKLYLADVEGQTTADITIGEEISAYAIYNEETYNPTLAVTAGNAVTVEGNEITAVIDGEATVTATYDIEGVEIVVTYTVNVSIPTFDGKVLYSTLDNKVILPEFTSEVTSIVDVDDATVYFDGTNYANIPTNETSAAITKNALVTLEDGMQYYITLDSYTKVLTTAQDFTIFNIETETTILSGSYVLGNDITTKEEVFFTHHGLHAADANNNLTGTTVYNYTGAGFAGTFDGLGHAVTMNVKGAYGIFGQFLAGAKVQNVAFYDMTIGLYRDDYARNAAGELISKAGAGQDRWNTLLARGAQNNARTVYVTDVFAEITEISSKGTWGSGFISSPGYINMTGVMVKFTPTIGNLHGAITGYTVANNSYTNGLIAITDQALASNTGWKWIGSNEGYADGDVVEDITYKVIANAYRYADYASLAADTANHETLYQHYSTEYWDLTSGYPVFKSILNIQNAETIASQTMFYLGGSSDATSADIYNTGDNTSVSAYAVYGGENYYPTLKVVSGETVTVSGSTITAAPLAEGESVVSATYTIANAKITVSYVINVSFPEYTAETIKYSTLDNQVFLPFDFDGKEIVSIVNTDDATVYYADGAATANVPQNTESSDLTDYTKNITITFADNTGYKTTLTSYTLVIDEEEDFAYLVTTGGTNVSSSITLALVKGYYILNNDIVHGTWEGNKTQYSGFAGTFDGDGHTVDLIVGSYGLFSGMAGGSVVKNVAFVVNNASTGRYVLAETSASYGKTGYLNSSSTTTFNDVYVDVNVPTTSSKMTTLFGGQYYYYINTNNFIYDFADGVRAWENGTWSYNGTFAGYINNSHFTQSSTQDINSDGVKDYVYSRTNHTNTYYINNDYPYIFAHNTSGKLDNVAVAQNDIDAFNQAITDYSATTSKIGWVKGISRYADYAAMADADLDLSSFDNGLWDISLGYPVWKGIKANDDSVLLINGEAGDSASIASGYTDSVTIDVEVDSQTVPVVLSVVDGAEFVRIEGNVVYADSAVPGTATVLVKANVNGQVVYKQVSIELTVTDMTAKTVMYSTLDNEMFFNDFSKEITNMSLVETETVVYTTEGATVPTELQNIDSKDLTDYTKEVIVTFADGTLAKTTLVSYTKVINEDDDFAVFESKTGETKAGYYIMINDITLDSWTGNASESGGGAKVNFTGIFDGQGHVAEIALDHYGIFGATTGATIKDTAFIVKSIGAKTFAYASILAYKMATTTVSDCYFKYDLPEGTAIDVSYYGYAQTSGLGLYAQPGNFNKFNNVVIDTTSVETTCVSNTEPYAYGSIVSKAQLNSSGVGGGTWQPVTSNVYVLSADKYLGYLASVTALGNTISAFNGIHTALFASNDTTAYSDCIANNKALITGSYRYDNMASALTAGETFSGLTASETGLWSLDNNGELMFNGITLGSVEVNTFISNGASEYAIVVPTSLSLTGTSALAYAVNDLHDYVSLATNGSVDLPIVKASEFNANTYPKYFSIGNTGLMTADVTSVTETLGDDGLFYFSEGDDVYFTGSTNYGVANGVYDFLRTYFGFDAITDEVVVYNENVTDVSFTTLHKVDVPDISERLINGVNAKTRARYGAHSGYMGYSIGGLYNANYTAWEIPSMHNTLDYIPYSIHSTEHGAYWYATDENNVIIGGTTPKDICYTAHGDAEQYQAMVNQFISRIKDTFAQRSRLKSAQVSGNYSWANSSWDTLAIMTEDNGTACNCSSCQEAKALYGTNSGAMIKFVNAVKAGVDAWFETATGSTYKIDNFKLMFSAYQKLIDAPVVFDESTGKYVPTHEDVVPADGVILQIATSESSGLSPYYSINAAENAQGKATIEKWATLVDEINLWTYQANFSNYLYFGDTFELFNEEGYTFFDNNKVNAWVNQNSNGMETSWALLKEYVSSKLMWNTNADLEEIYDNYFSAVYGTASVAMRNLFDMQREAFQDALASYATANPELSVAGYSNIFNGYYDDEKLATIIDGYKAALASVEVGSYAYYQIIKEAISPYYIALTNHNRHAAVGSASTNIKNSVYMDETELARIQTLKVEFKQMLDTYEAVYGKMHRTEHIADLSSDIVFNQLGYIFRPSNNPISLLIYSFDCTPNSVGTRVGAATRELTAGVHGIGWHYGYPDTDGHGGFDFRNITIEVLSGSSVAEITLGVDADGNELKWNNSTYVDAEGKLPATASLSARYQLGVINCKQAGTAVLRLHYDLDGMHYTYDLTLTVTA